YSAGSNPKWVVADDFNNDGKPDLAVADGGTNSPGVVVLLKNGAGLFGSPITVTAGGAATYLASADFNGDQKNDLVVVNESISVNAVSVLLGNGNGTFGSP